MKTIHFIGKLLCALVAIISGLITLIFNDVTYSVFDKLTETQKYVCVVITVLVGLFLLISTIRDTADAYSNMSRKHRLKYQSKKFISFFEKWYSKPGTLSIICDDLNWIKTEKNDLIYKQLQNKSKDNQLNLYLGSGYNSQISKHLKSLGANVYNAPANIIQHYTFSCLSVMGNAASRIIVRTKHDDVGDFVIFDEINSTYVTELLNSMLQPERSTHE